MATRLAVLAEVIGGRLAGARAIGDLMIDGAATLEDADEGQISLLDSPEKAHRLAKCRAGAVVVPGSFVPERIPAIQVADVHRAFATLVRHFRPLRPSKRFGV